MFLFPPPNPLPPGSYSSAGAASCSPCPAGKYTESNSSSTCTDCTAGKYLQSEGAFSQYACQNCAAGTYTPSTGLTVCQNCTAGSFSPEMSSGCTPCSAGWFFSSNASSTCTICPIGKYASSRGSSSCETCETGIYNVDEGSFDCDKCSGGKKLAIDIANGLGTGCVDCSDGEYSNPGATSCNSCDHTEGFVSKTGSETCSYCGPGLYADVISQSCEMCEVGKFSIGGKNNCEDCQLGFISNAVDGAGYCTPCPAGSYANPAQTECLPCAPGFISGIASTECTACEKGKFAEGYGNTGCTFCDDTKVLKGSTTNFTGATSSSSCQCNAGEYADEITNTCKQASEGISKTVVGMTTKNLTLEEGYWRTSPSSLQIEVCFNNIHCIGGSDPSSLCAPGYEGSICAECSSGYAGVGSGASFTCTKCTGGATAYVCAILTALFLALASF